MALSLGASAAIIGRGFLVSAFALVPAGIGFIIWMSLRPSPLTATPMRRSRKIVLGVCILVATFGLVASIQVGYWQTYGSAPPAGWSEALESGTGGFLQPDELAVGEWQSLTFLVGPSQRDLQRAADGERLASPKAITLSPRMRVTLIKDPNFEFHARTPSDLNLGADKIGLWQWDIKPLRGGTFDLFAQVDVLRQLSSGGFEPYDTYTKRVAVKVRVSPWERITDTIQGATSLGDLMARLFQSWEGALTALAALIGAVFGVWWAIRRGLRKAHSARLGRQVPGPKR